MSPENVEIVRAVYEAWNGPDGRRAALAFVADDFEWVNPRYAVEPGTPVWPRGLVGGDGQPGSRLRFRDQ